MLRAVHELFLSVLGYLSNADTSVDVSFVKDL